MVDYVSTKENPADIATRGTSIKNLANNRLWWHGPEWLKDSAAAWTRKENIKLEEVNDAEQSNGNKEESLTVAESEQIECQAPFDMDEKRYSTLTRLLRVTAYVLRFVKKIQKQDSESGCLNSSEIQTAENMWICYVQKRNYSAVFNGIVNKKPTNLQTQLGLVIDENNILRSKGRLENASLSEGANCSILLPPKETFTRLVVADVHTQNLHTGVSQTLALVRHRFWIPCGHATVRLVTQSCTVCRKFEGGPYKMPPMPALPKARVSEASPFNHTALDYLGPLHIKTLDGAKKVWFCLFTCLVTRDVHLELIQDMSAEEFLMAFRRFTFQRGTPCQIISDNASQFKAASVTLNSVWKSVIDDEDVQNFTSTKGIKWSFIVQLAPWMGGFYEHLVGIVKRTLRETLSRRLLTLIQLQTVLKEAEAVVNSRPLVYVGDDVSSSITLTPNHFLTLNPYIGIPDICSDDEDSEFTPQESSGQKLLRTWKKGVKLLKMFWKSWRDDYLLSLRERTQTTLKAKRIQSLFKVKTGDVVPIKEELSRGCWRTGRIVQLVPSRNNSVRAARVKLPSGSVLSRPLNQLYPIECSDIENGEETVQPLECEISKQQNIGSYRPQRKAALAARKFFPECI